MRYMGDVGVAPNLRGMNREQMAAAMAAAPPASTLFSTEDLQKMVDNADLIRDDYAEPIVEIALATGAGTRRKLMYVGIGAVAGLAVGALAMKLIGG